jgi:hypothetical protein
MKNVYTRSSLLITKNYKYFAIILLLLVAFVLPQKSFAQFTPGRLVVEQPQGTTAAASSISLLEYTTGGTAGTSLSLPSTTSGSINRITESGSATSDGQINLSSDGRYITVPGYDAATGTAAVATASINRVVARVDINQNILTTVINGTSAGTSGDLDVGNNFRTVITDAGTNYWLGGAANTSGDGTDGVQYIANSASSSTAQNCNLVDIESTKKYYANVRVVKIFNGQLYYSTQQSGAGTIGVYSVGTGLPTGSPSTVAANLLFTTQNPTATQQGPNSFVILPTYGPTPGVNYMVAYMTDDDNGGTKSEGIYKYYFNGTTWAAAGYDTTLGQKFHGLTAVIPAAGVDTTGSNGVNIQLYATDENKDIYLITDKTKTFAKPGTTVNFTYTKLVTSATNSFFGIAFAPLSTAISITNPGNQTICGTGSAQSVTFTSSANTSVNWVVTSSTITGLSNQFGNGNMSFTPTSTGTATVTAYAYYGDHACTSITFTITVNALPTIGGGGQPSTSTQTPCLNTAATALSVTAAAGSGTITTYQWYSNTSQSNAPGASGTLVATHSTGSTTDSYTPLTTVAGTLYYYCIVTNSNNCTVTSNPSGAITVNASPTIGGGGQPSTGTQTGCLNFSSTALSVTAAAGSGTISTYQWYSNTSSSNSSGTLVATHSSALTTDSYTPLTNVAGTLYYYCVVTNSNTCTVTSNPSGSITSNAFPTLSSQPYTGTQTLCLNASISALSFTAAAGSGSISSYNWYSNTSSSNSGGTSVEIDNTSSTTDNFTPATNIAGTLYYYSTVTNSNGCSVTTNPSGAIIISTGDTWTGGTSTDWSVGGNWSCGSVPTSASDVIIPSVTNQPVLSTSVGVHSITMQSSTNLILNGYTFTLNGTFSGSNTGTLYISSGSSLVIGGAAGTLYFSGPSTLTNFTINDGASAILGSPLNIASAGTLSVGTLTGHGAVLSTGGYLTLLSDDNGSARVASAPNGNGGGFTSVISGNVNVQCYIHSVNSSISTPRRAWRLLTAPITDNSASPVSTIYTSWQNDGVYALGLGTMITAPPAIATGGSGNGMDAGINGNYSDYTWNPGTQQLVPISNTISTDISGTTGNADNIGYFIFIRGDRNPSTIGNPSYASVGNTTLSASGPLQLGDQVFSTSTAVISNVANGLSLVGNPYACSVDFSELAGDKSGYTTSYLNNIINRIYVWNSNLTGSSGVGGYTCIDDPNNTNGYYTNSVLAGPATVGDVNIQSGQAFFVQTQNGGSASITFKELAKSTTNNFIYRPAAVAAITPNEFRATLSLLNVDSSTSLTDGVVVQFRNGYCDCVDFMDAPKFSNADEMFSLARHGKQLSIERRPDITSTDTLFLNLKQMSQRNYQFNFSTVLPNNPGIVAHLEDSYTGTHTPLTTNGSNTVDFTVNSDVASQAQNRFMVVLDVTGALPITFSTAKATQLGNNNVEVQWTVQNESNIKEYEVEKSTDSSNFSTVATVTAKGGSTDTYNWIDSNEVKGSNNYYRIVAIDNNGSTGYSPVMDVDIINEENSGISVYPNPAQAGEALELQFADMPHGVYPVQLVDNTGRLILTTTVTNSGIYSIEPILLPKYIVPGTYGLRILKPDNSVTAINIMVVN